MQDFSWIAPLKQGVLVMYFLLFCGIIAWAWSLRSPEDLAAIPFRGECDDQLPAGEKSEAHAS